MKNRKSKKSRKVLSIMLSAALLLSLVPSSTLASGAEETIQTTASELELTESVTAERGGSASVPSETGTTGSAAEEAAGAETGTTGLDEEDTAASESETTQSETMQTDAAQTGSVQSETTQSETDQTGPTQSETTQSEMADLDAPESGSASSDADSTEAGAGTGTSETADSASAESGAGETVASGSGTTGSETAQLSSAQGETTEGETTESGADGGVNSQNDESLILCAHGNSADDCVICDLETQIAGLPTLEEVETMEGEELDAIYELTSALADIYYDELTEEEQVQVSNIDALWEILDYFSGAVMATAFAYDSDGFYTSGDTTYYQPATLSNGVYQISNAGQLFWLASLVNGDTTQEDITEAVSGANAKLTANINLQNKTWVPIGSYSGTFDGNGKTISGLYINSTSGYQGFFSTVSGGTVKSLTLSGNGITGAGSTGSIAGALTNGGTIESCTNNVPVTGSGYYVGGIVGYVAKGNITSCTNNAALSNTSADLGGIAGFIESGCTVSSCTNTGTVSGSSSYFGGIVGNSGTSSAGGNTISNCINSGAVSCNNNVGGILGYMMNTTAVSGCVNSGAVSATGGWVGGVVGNMTTASSSSVSSCSNSGTVTGGGDYTGGVVAYAAGSITGCSNSGAVTGSGDYTGGIIGSGAIAVSQCANTGTVSGPRRVGGIIGRLSSGGTVRNCYNAGAVSCTNQYAGGIVGESYGTIYVSHNYGKITGTSVGAIIGYVNSSGAISSAWYLSDTGNSVYGTGKTVGANARTTGQFASGYVTYSMQNTAGSSQIWGQDLTSATPDPYPVLTSDSSKKVLQVTIILVDGSSQTTLETSYTNYGKTLLSYPTLTGDDTYEFYSDSACTQSWDTSTVFYDNKTIYAVKVSKNTWTSALTMSGWTYGGNAVEPAASSAYGIVEYAYYTDSDCTAKTTSDNSGASEEGGKPVNAGTYYVQASVAASVTYTGLISDAASFTIGKASLTITANANTITYGDAPSANGVTYSGFVNEESESTNGVLSGTLTYSYSYSQYGAVGEYTITPSGLSAANYEITYAAGKLTVEQRTAVLTWTTLAADELVYDGNEKTLTATVGNKAQENDEISVTVELTADCDNVNVTANGFSYTATGLTGAASGNYKLPDNTVSATYRITAAAVTITAADASKTYGEADPAFTVTVTGTATEADRTGLKVSYSRAEGENAGTYTITPSYTGNSNYSVEVVPATFTIYKKAVTVTADDKSSIYGSNLEELTFTVPEGALAGDDKGSDLCVNLTTTAAKGSAVGTYEIIGTSTSGNYEVTVEPAAYTIKKASLTITAKDNTITYGDAPSANGVSYSGFVNEESESTNGVLSGTLTYSYSYSKYGSVGEYVITPSGLSAANYEITYSDGKLTVEQQTAVLTWTTLDMSDLIYDGTAKTLSATVGNKAQENDEISVTVERTAGCDNVNVTTDGFSYTATGLTGAASGNYKLPDNTVSTTYQIVAAAVTITAADASKTYGDADPTLTGTVTGTATEADLAGLKVSYSRAEGENAGTYTITPSYTGNSNYSVEVVPATFTIYKKAVTVTADDKISVYGTALETLTFTIPQDALVAGDTEDDLAVILTKATVAEDVGTDETGSGDTDTDEGGTGGTGADDTDTDEGGTGESGSGDTDTDGNDMDGGVTDGTDAAGADLAGKDVGIYAITGTSTAANYEVTVIPATYTITKAALTITANDNTITYGDAPSDTGVSYSGFVYEESEDTDGVFEGELTYAFDYSQYGDVGTYSITPSGLTSANYEITYETGSLTVGQRIVELDWSTLAADELVYDGNAKTLTATVGNKAQENDDIAVTVERTADCDNVNVTADGFSYTATALTGAASGNYALPENTVSETHQITSAAVTVTANDVVRSYGDDNPTFAFTISAGALASGDTTDDLGVTLSTTADKNSAAGTYAITGTSTSVNYDVTVVSGTMTVAELTGLPEQTFPDTDAAHKIILQVGLSEVPEALKDNPNLNTVEKITAMLKTTVTKQSGYSEENVVVYDVTLMVSFDGGVTWEKATEESFPVNGLTLLLPYPDGTGKDTHDFAVTHMFTSAALGKTPGEMESPAVTKTADGLLVTVTGLSPIAVAWKLITQSSGETAPTTPETAATEAATPETTATEAATPETTATEAETKATEAETETTATESETETETATETEAPVQTGDDTPLSMWLTLFLLSAAVLLMMGERKRQRG